jgi:thiol-disulfide isomerase/thioredoxin
MRRVLILSTLILAGVACNTAWSQVEAVNPEYVQALETTRNAAEALQSYELEGSLIIENRTSGEAEVKQLEVSLRGAARWPDRLLSSQISPVFNLNLGVGADQSWFYLGQAGTCYLGKTLALSRRLDGAEQMELEESQVFNFYSGIGTFMLNGELSVLPETGSEILVVGDKDIPCQVFRTAAGNGGQGAADGEKTFWFDPASGLVLQANLKSRMVQQGTQIDQVMTFKLDRFQLNQPVAEEVFSFTPSADTRIVPSLDRVLNPDSMTGETAADVTFSDLEGNPVQLSEFKGKVVFLDFWATWCGPCKMEMPHIQKLHEEMGGEVVFLGASSEPKAKIEGFLTKNPYSFKIVTVKQEDAQKKFNVSNIPAGFVIDREGVIRAHLIGAQTESQLRQALARAGIR